MFIWLRVLNLPSIFKSRLRSHLFWLTHLFAHLLNKQRHFISYAPVPIPSAEVSRMNKT